MMSLVAGNDAGILGKPDKNKRSECLKKRTYTIPHEKFLKGQPLSFVSSQEIEDRFAGSKEERGQTWQWKIQSA